MYENWCFWGVCKNNGAKIRNCWYFLPNFCKNFRPSLKMFGFHPHPKNFLRLLYVHIIFYFQNFFTFSGMSSLLTMSHSGSFCGKRKFESAHDIENMDFVIKAPNKAAKEATTTIIKTRLLVDLPVFDDDSIPLTMENLSFIIRFPKWEIFFVKFGLAQLHTLDLSTNC